MIDCRRLYCTETRYALVIYCGRICFVLRSYWQVLRMWWASDCALPATRLRSIRPIRRARSVTSTRSPLTRGLGSPRGRRSLAEEPKLPPPGSVTMPAIPYTRSASHRPKPPFRPSFPCRSWPPGDMLVHIRLPAVMHPLAVPRQYARNILGFCVAPGPRIAGALPLPAGDEINCGRAPTAVPGHIRHALEGQKRNSLTRHSPSSPLLQVSHIARAGSTAFSPLGECMVCSTTTARVT